MQLRRAVDLVKNLAFILFKSIVSKFETIDSVNDAHRSGRPTTSTSAKRNLKPYSPRLLNALHGGDADQGVEFSDMFLDAYIY